MEEGREVFFFLGSEEEGVLFGRSGVLFLGGRRRRGLFFGEGEEGGVFFGEDEREESWVGSFSVLFFGPFFFRSFFSIPFFFFVLYFGVLFFVTFLVLFVFSAVHVD